MAQRVVVLGATGFLGSALTELLIGDGYHVEAVGRSVERLDALRDRAAGCTLLRTHATDLADPHATARTAEAVASSGPAHLAIATLGGWYVAEQTVDLPIDRWQRTISENLTTHFVAAQAFGGVLAGPAPAYVALNGIASHFPCEGSVAISVTGAGQRMLIDVLASEACPPTVRYGEVVVDTPIVPPDDPVDEDAHSPQRVLRAIWQLVGEHPGPGFPHRVVLGAETADVPRATFDTPMRIGED